MYIRILTAISKWQYKCMYFKCNFKILKVNKKKKAINSQMSYLKTSKSRRTPKKKRKKKKREELKDKKGKNRKQRRRLSISILPSYLKGAINYRTSLSVH